MTKYAFKRLQELSPDMVEEVDRRLLAGETPSSVAAWLQDDVGAFKDLQQSSLKKQLERYRGTGLKAKVLQEVTEKTNRMSAVALRKRVNALTELQELAERQKARFEKVFMREHPMPGGILLKQVGDEARLLKEILVELGKLQLETGMGLVRAPRRIMGSITDPDGEVKEFAWTEEQEQLYRELEVIDVTPGASRAAE